jgi:hypothetical protein
MRVVLPTYRSIGWIVKAYALLHEKYWGVPVTLLAEDDYSDGQFEFVRAPTGFMVDGEVHSSYFTDTLIWYLRRIPDEFVIVMLADYLITEPAHVDRLSILEEYLTLHKEIMRGQVGDDGGYCGGELTETFQGLAMWEGNFLATSLTPGMWSRQKLLLIAQPGTDAWGFEQRGRDKFLSKGYRSVAPAPGCLSYINALRGRDMHNIVITEEVYAQVKHLLKIQPKGWA